MNKHIERLKRDEALRLEQYIIEMEKLLKDMKASVALVKEDGIAAMRGVAQRGTADLMAYTASQVGKSAHTLSTLADVTDILRAEEK